MIIESFQVELENRRTIIKKEILMIAEKNKDRMTAN